MNRATLKTEFLSTSGWGDARLDLLAGDASNRRYDRITHPDGRRAVLMDAPSEKGEDIAPFLRVGRQLSGIGLSCPRVHDSDAATGFILMEDLGDDLYFNLLESGHADETQLYEAALQVLDVVHDANFQNLPDYLPPQMAEAACTLADWYDTRLDRGTLKSLTSNALDVLDWSRPVLVHRDYHAQNLLWLPERDGAARVGLLDFQDAAWGHAIYDVASLINDARRDIALDVRAHLMDSGRQKYADFDSAFATLSAQRNMRILGVFARLSHRDGKAGYLQLIPRVWRHLQNDLSHPVLSDLKGFLKDLTPPTEFHLASLLPRGTA